MCRLGNISSLYFLNYFCTVSVCLDYCNEKFGYNNYVYRDVGTYSKSIKTSTNALLETTGNSN